MKTTYLLVPAFSDQAGKVRVVAMDHEWDRAPGLVDYRANPELWREAGTVNSRGELVALDGGKEIWEDMKSCEPIFPPLTFTYEATTEAEQAPRPRG